MSAKFWIVQASFALAAAGAVAFGVPGCDQPTPLAICTGAVLPPTCVDTGSEPAGCASSDDCNGLACCDEVCSENSFECPIDGGTDGGTDSGTDAADASSDAPED